MHLRIHLTILLVFLAAHTVTSSIANSSPKNGDKLKTTDSDLYIDDEGDDEIQLQDEASGSGPAKPVTVDEEDEEEDEDEDEDEGIEYDKEEPIGRTSAAPTSTTAAPVKEVEKRVEIKEDPVLPPKVSPVSGRMNPAYEDDDDDLDIQGSGGAGGHSGDGDVEEDEDDYDPDEGIDITSITGETDVPTRVEEPKKKPEEPKKPETMVPPSSPPPKTPKGSDGSSAVGKSPSGREENQIPDVVTPPPAVPGSNELDNDVHILDHKTEDRPTSFFAQPGILAAVIGGAVVGLLCAILLVMFIVYRMRKKDEGSYVLDEPKRNSPSSHPYNKNSREFYA